MTNIKDEVRRLRRKFREGRQELTPAHVASSCTASQSATAQDSNAAIPVPAPCESSLSETENIYNGHKRSALQDCISHTDKVYDAVKILLLKLFSEEYILNHSVSGKASNSKLLAKPAFDLRLYSAMVLLLKEKFEGLASKVITEKVHSVQKILMKQHKK